MFELLQPILSNLPDILEAVIQIVGAFAVLATLTPNQSDDKIVQTILNAVNFLGANFGKAVNEEKSHYQIKSYMTSKNTYTMNGVAIFSPSINSLLTDMDIFFQEDL